jgi:hypothetical protein
VTAAARAGSARERWPVLAGWLLTALAVGFAAWVYWGLGPRPKARAWWEPKASLSRALAETSLAPLVEELPLALGGFGLAALALAAAVFATTRSATARFLAVFGVVATLCFVFYSVEARFVWSFFRWRWSASLALFAAAVAAAATAPLLAASWLRRSGPARVALYLPILLGVIAYERNVTGTDQSLRFAISPWPVVQIFGLELAAACVGALVAGVGIGLHAVARARRGGGAALWALGGVAAAGLPVAALGLASLQDLLPFAAGPGFFALLAAASLVAFVLTATLGLGGSAERTAERALVFAVGGVLALAPIALGQVLARLDYATTRDQLAQGIIRALDGYRAREGAYPDELSELVAAGDLAQVPAPRIGFRFLGAQEFVYQNFGESYLLEFSAPRWIQCAYNPPYLESEEEDAEDVEGAEVESELAAEDVAHGEWSCPSKPPELW